MQLKVLCLTGAELILNVALKATDKSVIAKTVSALIFPAAPFGLIKKINQTGTGKHR
ncbi:hypothetical protein [Morganella morganii]|uniref:hypothetical protein n=1 Tax=Morganella morganii TaxID=582 RepID=UPI000ADCEFDA|nr:hypothetical protein [Morganella morganii]BEP22515.1 hypothetical protein SUGSMm_33120 [Morganella morganii subsp. sibonii]EKK5376500.1 hypothetical protein [Morganella morganii]EKK5378656.1 hypothetical protein [Morganella morganii]EKW7746153.1 hypothetical protein [Morganella morganii]EKW7747737.1 hypothetical protein [Morganella morganii]